MRTSAGTGTETETGTGIAAEDLGRMMLALSGILVVFTAGFAFEELGAVFAFAPWRLGDVANLPDFALGLTTLFSYVAIHNDLAHVLFNGVSLIICCLALTGRAPVSAILALFLLGSVAGALTHLAFTTGEPLAGASAGICALAAAWIRVETAQGRRLLGFGALWLTANFASGAVALDVETGYSRIAWEAHVGGFLAGLFLTPLLFRSDQA